MNVKEVNRALSLGEIHKEGVFPHLEDLAASSHVFQIDFGLPELPTSPGLLVIRGARQYGKSTWLEGEMRKTVVEFGAGSAYYLNGDEIGDAGALAAAVRELVPLYRKGAAVKRLFIDEVTAIADWQRGLKRLLDAGELRGVLVVTTGSKAHDLRRGGERLPGRKGKLDRTSYLFTPVCYREFRRVCGERLGGRSLPAYLLSGGSPLACSEIAAHGKLPEFVIETVRDWIYGECALAGRSRASLLAIMESLMRWGGTPVSQAKLAREAGLANNTVAAGYLELLADLLAVATMYSWDSSRNVRLARRPCKHPFINLLVAVAWHPSKLIRPEDVETLAPPARGVLVEWLVAREIWRRRARRGDEMPEVMAFWQSKEHELDFVLARDEFLEVKSGPAAPVDFSWFPRVFPDARLTVINANRFETERVVGKTLEDFLLEG